MLERHKYDLHADLQSKAILNQPK